MTVADLIGHLRAFPPNALVVTDGYEDGYEHIKRIALIPIEENPGKEWWLGQYRDSQAPGAQQAVYLNSETKADKL